MIETGLVAFDIDGVFADTMTLFLDIARDEYNINAIEYEDIVCYDLETCTDIDPKILDAILHRILDGDYRASLSAFPYASTVLNRIGWDHGSLLFVTARPHVGPIEDWVIQNLSLASDAIEVVAIGTYDGKADLLVKRGITHFVEDRLETCFTLAAAGIRPILFRQPWNRKPHPFIEVDGWRQLESLIAFKGTAP